MVNATAPIGTLRTLDGREFEVLVVLRPLRKALPSAAPPPSITVSGESVETSSNVFPLRKVG